MARTILIRPQGITALELASWLCNMVRQAEGDVPLVMANGAPVKYACHAGWPRAGDDPVVYFTDEIPEAGLPSTSPPTVEPLRIPQEAVEAAQNEYAVGGAATYSRMWFVLAAALRVLNTNRSVSGTDSFCCHHHPMVRYNSAECVYNEAAETYCPVCAMRTLGVTPPTGEFVTRDRLVKYLDEHFPLGTAVLGSPKVVTCGNIEVRVEGRAVRVYADGDELVFEAQDIDNINVVSDVHMPDCM